MKTYRRVYLDANVLIDLAQNQEEIGSLLQSIVDAHPIDRRPPLFVTSELTFSEVLVKPYRLKLDSLASFYLEIRMGSYWLDVGAVTFRVLERAAALRAASKSLKLPDAIHVGTAQILECSHFLTNDLGLTEMGEIKHPLLDERLPPISILRADIGTLSRILAELAP
jgi:predicted nucleic acid-binding protein